MNELAITWRVVKQKENQNVRLSAVSSVRRPRGLPRTSVVVVDAMRSGLTNIGASWV